MRVGGAIVSLFCALHFVGMATHEQVMQQNRAVAETALEASRQNQAAIQQLVQGPLRRWNHGNLSNSVCAFGAGLVREAKDPVSLPDMNEATKSRSTLLYSLLAGLHHERRTVLRRTGW